MESKRNIILHSGRCSCKNWALKWLEEFRKIDWDKIKPWNIKEI